MRSLYGTAGNAQMILVTIFMATSIALVQQPLLAQETSTSQKPSQNPIVTAQQTDSPSEKQGSSPASQATPGRISLEDLLLQKGSITKEEWLRIRSEQEYQAVHQTRRLDNLEDWKSRTEVLPILRDKVNIGLNALQFLYGHVNANVPEGRSQDSLSIRRAAGFVGKTERLSSALAYVDGVSKYEFDEQHTLIWHVQSDRRDLLSRGLY